MGWCFGAQKDFWDYVERQIIEWRLPIQNPVGINSEAEPSTTPS